MKVLFYFGSYYDRIKKKFQNKYFFNNLVNLKWVNIYFVVIYVNISKRIIGNEDFIYIWLYQLFIKNVFIEYWLCVQY